MFNPGFERVEGYSNLLWVLILAGFSSLGNAPEAIANGLSLAATVALWSSVAWFGLRHRPAPGQEWVGLVAPFLLAITRSVAVWSTSGLETRWFEALVVAGALRLVIEVEAELGGAPRRFGTSGLLFGFAALTRPDGLLLAAAAFGTAGVFLASRRCFDLRRFSRTLLPLAILVLGQFAFRIGYYGEWWPNTYYAKVDGRWWWSSGLAYLSAFVLEYAAYLWLPFLAAAVFYHLARSTSFVPLLFASLIVPHALYIAAIGGDHFEYRPIDLYLPFVFLLIQDGVRFLVGLRRATWGVAGWLALVGWGLVWLPYQSHRQFPHRYIAGFPGDVDVPTAERDAFLSPERDPIHRLPGFRWIAERHVDLLRRLSARFVGLRQEEHRMFLATVVPEGRELRALVDRGVLPADTYLATDCVGAIPYYSDLRTLDRLGLTDATIAHGPSRKVWQMAHDKEATLEYARAKGVDLWAFGHVHFLVPASSRLPLTLASQGARFQAASAGEGLFLVVVLPQGLEQAARKMPRLAFHESTSDTFLAEYLEQGIAAYRDNLRRGPLEPAVQMDFAYFLLVHRDYEAALVLYRELARTLPDEVKVWTLMGHCYDRLGQPAQAAAAKEEARRVALRQLRPRS